MNYAIIATLGPSTQDESAWQALLDAGTSAFRLNTSHLSLSDLSRWLERLARFYSSQGKEYPLYLDLQGSKWRLGELPEVELAAGDVVQFIHADRSSQPGVLPVPHADFFRAAALSNPHITLNDGRVRLELLEVQNELLAARVTHPGLISAHKGLTYTQSAFRSEALGPKDLEILRTSRGLPYIRYAISYVKDGEEMGFYRRQAGAGVFLAAKIERETAVEDTMRTTHSANEVWLCRGDLGAELGLPRLAQAVHRFTHQIRRLAVPALIAGGLFEHMITHPQPARSEVCYLHDALLDGYQGLVLSDETAVGSYPRESCLAAGMFLNQSLT